MKSMTEILKKNKYEVLLIFLCYLFTSGGHLAWTYHLTHLLSPTASDLLSMVAAYLCQGAGIALYSLAAVKAGRTWTGQEDRRSVAVAIALYVICMIPAVMSRSTAGAVLFGLIMSVFCGYIAAYYIDRLMTVGFSERGRVFGASYAGVTLLSWIISLIGRGALVRGGRSVVLQSLAAAVTVWLIIRLPGSGENESGKGENSTTRENDAAHEFPLAAVRSDKTLLRICALTLMVSMVKNIGSGFSSIDLLKGVSVEFTRIFYAAGLIIAGSVTDRSRKDGAILTITSLVLPFIVLALSGEPVPTMFFWVLGYFVFGFFSVYRIITFTDRAQEKRAPLLAGGGLLFGRIGDAAGTAVSTLLSGSQALMVASALVFFIISIVLFFSLYQELYEPQAAAVPEVKSEEERFALFAAKYDMSAREREVLRLVLRQMTNTQIAETLVVSESTVKFHIHNLLRKTGCKTRLELGTLYLQSKD